MSYLVSQVFLRYLNRVQLHGVTVGLECHLILSKLFEYKQQKFVVVTTICQET